MMMAVVGYDLRAVKEALAAEKPRVMAEIKVPPLSTYPSDPSGVPVLLLDPGGADSGCSGARLLRSYSV